MQIKDGKKQQKKKRQKQSQADKAKDLQNQPEAASAVADTNYAASKKNDVSAPKDYAEPDKSKKTDEPVAPKDYAERQPETQESMSNRGVAIVTVLFIFLAIGAYYGGRYLIGLS